MKSALCSLGPDRVGAAACEQRLRRGQVVRDVDVARGGLELGRVLELARQVRLAIALRARDVHRLDADDLALAVLELVGEDLEATEVVGAAVGRRRVGLGQVAEVALARGRAWRSEGEAKEASGEVRNVSKRRAGLARPRPDPEPRGSPRAPPGRACWPCARRPGRWSGCAGAVAHLPRGLQHKHVEEEPSSGVERRSGTTDLRGAGEGAGVVSSC